MQTEMGHDLLVLDKNTQSDFKTNQGMVSFRENFFPFGK